MRANASRPTTLRLIAGYGAIASALPYLTLKIIWLSGGTIGVADPVMMNEPSMVVLNAITATMDVVGIGLALAFTHSWGLRVPASLLLPSMWVATGLLARFILGVPVVALLSVLAPDSAPPIRGGPVVAWVYVLVYMEFAGLGAGLLMAFAFHALTRWPGVFRPSSRHSPPGATHRLEIVLANTAAPAAIALAVVCLAWAFGATAGLAETANERRTVIGAVVNAIDALLMLAAAAGVLMIVHRIGDTLPGWLPVSMAWIGTGSLFGWGLWQTVNVLGETALVRGAEERVFVNLVGLLRLVVGLVLGLLAAVVLVERQAAARTRAGVERPLDPDVLST